MWDQYIRSACFLLIFSASLSILLVGSPLFLTPFDTSNCFFKFFALARSLWFPLVIVFCKQISPCEWKVWKFFGTPAQFISGGNTNFKLVLLRNGLHAVLLVGSVLVNIFIYRMYCILTPYSSLYQTTLCNIAHGCLGSLSFSHRWKFHCFFFDVIFDLLHAYGIRLNALVYQVTTKWYLDVATKSVDT